MLFENTFKALSDPTRRKILELLRAGPMCAGDLCDKFGLTAATVSHHLSVLKDADLVFDKKAGKYIYYEINTSVVEDILTWVMMLKGDGNEEH
ncbi:MAG: winged helix-turn-helix transcriptional regulator [Oscillospiraceae bacterium]|nr:winged helix-turn-helix transcriptional regulator [Oscillospiraceae bacterium]